jgi:hypothetical protein
MNLISNKLHRLYLVIALLLIIPDTFYWYTLNDYSNYQDAFTAITSSTGLTWLIVSYLALFFSIFAQNLEMRAFLTVVAFVTRIFFLVWLTDIWRANEVAISTLFKNVFIKTGEAPFVEAFATVALVPLVLALIVQKTRIANLLTGLVNFLKAPANKIHRAIFYSISVSAYLLSLIAMIRSLLDNYDLESADLSNSFQQSLIWLILLGVIQIALKLLILGLGLLACLWAWITLRADIQTVLRHMKDFKFTEFITLRVASHIYAFYFTSIVGLAAIGIPIYASTSYGINQDYAAFPMVTITGAIITFLLLLSIRLFFEFFISFIKISQFLKSQRMERN